MMRILKVLKGVATSAVLWALGWVPLTLFIAGVATVFGAPPPPRELWGVLLLRQAIAGAINGAFFVSALALLGRRRTFDSLSFGLVAACGAIGGITFPILMAGVFVQTSSGALPWVSMLVGAGFSSVVGAAFAAQSLHVARRAPTLGNGGSEEAKRLTSTTA